jgi:hypothetical protein
MKKLNLCFIKVENQQQFNNRASGNVPPNHDLQGQNA